MMSEIEREDSAPDPRVETLETRNQLLQAELISLRQKMRETEMVSNLRVAAIRAGMIDLDGIKLLDFPEDPDPELPVASADVMIADLKRAKPWLFGGRSTSSAKEAPPTQPVRHKRAMDMTEDEYQAARASLLNRRA
jgi:hypothetical protein